MTATSASNVVELRPETVGAEVPVPKKRLPCTFDGCEKQRHAKKLCDGHYQQLVKTGQTWPLSNRRRRPSFVRNTDLPCTFDGCENKRATGELCHGHSFQHRHGQALSPLWTHAKLKVCRVCKDPGKPRTPKFFRVARNATGLSGTCRTCASKKSLAKTLERFGVERDWYELTLAQQHGGCAICRTTNPGRGGRFRIDHDHQTGNLRGLLCHACNVGIGLLGDSRATILAAAAYLERNGK